MSLEGMQRRIASTQSLRTLVRTMKTLAAVNVHHFQEAMVSLKEYDRTVQLGLQVVLKRASVRAASRSPEDRPLGAIILGTDQGMCGPFNERIAAHALGMMHARRIEPENRFLIVVGERLKEELEQEGQRIEKSFLLPGSLGAVTEVVQQLLIAVDEWRSGKDLDRIVLFHNRRNAGPTPEPHTLFLLPLDRRWLEQIQERVWPSRVLPTFTMDPEKLLSALLREYLFVSLFRALVESLMSENASRLMAMQAAEKNVEEQLAELRLEYFQERQLAITSELLDIVSGFEVLRSEIDPHSSREEGERFPASAAVLPLQ